MFHDHWIFQERIISNKIILGSQAYGTFFLVGSILEVSESCLVFKIIGTCVRSTETTIVGGQEQGNCKTLIESKLWTYVEKEAGCCDMESRRDSEGLCINFQVLYLF